MLNGTVLDVAVGLIFVFLILSACCSLLNERIQSALQTRAKMLEDALRKLLGNESQSPFHGVKAHALISAISHSRSGMPSYLPSATFAQALLDTLAPADGQSPMTSERLREAIAQLPEHSRKALLALTNTVENDIAAVRVKLERWFDDAMDRLSGAYKRHIQIWIFVLGFIVAAGTNADSIMLVQRLEHESALRAQVTTQVAKVDPSGQQPTPDQQFEQLEQLQRLELLFWDTRGFVTADQAASYPRAARQLEWSPSWFGWLALKIIGFLMTALAVSIGAPFWFDLLGRIVNLRAAGAKPPRSAAAEGETKAAAAQATAK